MSVRPLLEHRAAVRAAVRACFEGRGFVEVDTPVLSREILPEPYIEPVSLTDGQGTRYLQTSPEALMKRLLARASGPIYQFAHCFRAEERSPRHDTEFIMLEWYQPGASLKDTAELVSDLLRHTLGTTGLERISCQDAFGQHAGVDPLTATTDELLAAATEAGLVLPEGTADLPATERRSLAFDLLLSEVVSPRLGLDRPVMLEAWPAAEAAFGRLDPLDPSQARRFEVFSKGVELANGWEEEPSATILRERLLATNQLRQSQGRRVLPLPERLLAAHGKMMPGGVGAALGFDRLVMLASNAPSIDAVRGFNSDTA
jgi:lysyl-tRNA synthetase class 2